MKRRWIVALLGVLLASSGCATMPQQSEMTPRNFGWNIGIPLTVESIEGISVTSAQNGDVLYYDSTGEEWLNSQGNITFLPNSIDFAPDTDSTSYLQIYDADGGTPILNIDTTNERVGIGTATPTYPLDVDAGSNANMARFKALSQASISTIWLSNTGTASTSNETGFDFRLNTSTQERTAARIASKFSTTTDASRVGKIGFQVIESGSLVDRLTINGSKIGLATTDPNATLAINGSQSVKRTSGGAADYNPSALTSDYLIVVDNTAAARAVTISTEDVASGTTGLPRIFLIKDEFGNAGSNNITVALESGTIDGAASQTISTNYGAIQLYCTGTNCFVY